MNKDMYDSMELFTSFLEDYDNLKEDYTKLKEENKQLKDNRRSKLDKAISLFTITLASVILGACIERMMHPPIVCDHIIELGDQYACFVNVRGGDE